MTMVTEVNVARTAKIGKVLISIRIYVNQIVILRRVTGVLAGVTVMKLRSVLLHSCWMMNVMKHVTMRAETMTIEHAIILIELHATEKDV